MEEKYREIIEELLYIINNGNGFLLSSERLTVALAELEMKPHRTERD